jgi:hypothetical protein
VLFRKAYSTALVTPIAVVGNTSGFGNRLAVVVGIPVPLSKTVCGAPIAELCIVKVAKKGPDPVGVNVTLTEQFDAATVIAPEQLFVAWNAFGLAPPIGVVNVKVVLPVFCKKTLRGLLVVPAVCLPNSNEVGETGASVAVAFNPVPDRETDCRAGSLSVTVNVPNAKPADVGEKTMLNVQLCPGASPPPTGQVLLGLIKPGGRARVAMFVRLGPPAADTFISVTTIGLLVVPTT